MFMRPQSFFVMEKKRNNYVPELVSVFQQMIRPIMRPTKTDKDLATLEITVQLTVIASTAIAAIVSSSETVVQHRLPQAKTTMK